jgi:uncharacterized protein (TIGR04255 family)
MAIHFPSVPEIKLKNAPVREVICQVKFPTILKINQDVPTDFQDLIRGRFPEFSQEQGWKINLPDEKQPPGSFLEFGSRTFRFRSINSEAGATLSVNFFAVTSTQYKHWHEFIKDFQLVQRAFEEIYHPEIATRIGLRFINQFTLKNTASKSISELLSYFKSQLTCLLKTDAWESPDSMTTQLGLVQGTEKLVLRTSYTQAENEPMITLDFDAFEEKPIKFDELLPKLVHFHEWIYAAFRWSVSEEALTRFEPIKE